MDKQQKIYPIGGYAPGNYWNVCSSCKEQFQGDKRAVQCEPCAEKSTSQPEAHEVLSPSFGNLREQITTILKEEIHYSGQTQGFVVHGAIEKLESLFRALSQRVTQQDALLNELSKTYPEIFAQLTTGGQPF